MQDPSSSAAVTYFLPASLALICFAMGLGLKASDFIQLMRKPSAAIIGLIGQLVLLPALAFLIAYGTNLPTYFAVGLVLVAACPGGAHSNLLSYLAKGDVALSVSLTAVSGLICVVSIPFYVYLASIFFVGESQRPIDLSLVDTLSQLTLIILLPILIGMMINRYMKNVTILRKLVKMIAVFLLALIVVGAAMKGWAKVAQFAAEIGVAVVLLNLSGMAIGAILAKSFGLPGAQIATLSIEVGVQNTTLAFGLAMTVLNSFDVAVPAIVYALWVYIAAFTVICISRSLLKGSFKFKTS